MTEYCSICGMKINKAHTDEQGKPWYLQICSLKCGKEAFGKLTENMRAMKTTEISAVKHETKQQGNYNDELLEKMRVLRGFGWSYERIGRKLKVQPSIVRYQVIKMEKEAAENVKTI